MIYSQTIGVLFVLDLFYRIVNIILFIFKELTSAGINTPTGFHVHKGKQPRKIGRDLATTHSECKMLRKRQFFLYRTLRIKLTRFSM